VNIAYLTAFDPFSSTQGGEINTRDLALDMAMRGHDVWIFHAYSPEWYETEHSGVRVCGVRCERIPFLGGLQANRRLAVALTKVSRVAAFDILDLRGAGLGYAFSRCPGRIDARVYHAVDVPSVELKALPLREQWLKAPLYYSFTRYERLAIDSADWILVDTRSVGYALQRLYPRCSSRWSALPPALPAHWNSALDIEYDPHQFIYIGAGARRDTGLFLKALCLLNRRGVKATGVVLREPRRRFALQAQRLGLKVTFLSRIPEDQLRRLYARSCAFVLPSFREAFCRSIIEAAIHGTPSIVSNLAPVREFVRDGDTGIVVLDWKPESWSAAMAGLAASCGLRESLGRRAKEQAQPYLMSTIGARTEHRYRSILSTHHDI
jgi:glycosyltransferase involved in cell wall biosynthesis